MLPFGRHTASAPAREDRLPVALQRPEVHMGEVVPPGVIHLVRATWLWVNTNGIPFGGRFFLTTHFRLPIFVAGLNRMFTAGTIRVLTHGHFSISLRLTAGSSQKASVNGRASMFVWGRVNALDATFCGSTPVGQQKEYYKSTETKNTNNWNKNASKPFARTFFPWILEIAAPDSNQSFGGTCLCVGLSKAIPPSSLTFG